MYFNRFASSETDHHIAAVASGIDYTVARLLQRVHWLSKSHSTCRRATYYSCEHTAEFDTAVVLGNLPNAWIHPQVGPESNIQPFLPTLYNTGWMGNREVCYGSFNNIPILHPVDVKRAFVYFASRYHNIQWHVQSYMSHYMSVS